VVVCGDDIDTQPKPNPHNALKICETLGIDPKVGFRNANINYRLMQEAFMVGDTLADVKMGRSAQLAGSIGVLSGIASKHELGS
jgi:phosphoglycolate phosphatase-like HAD superfamily hydrolase